MVGLLRWWGASKRIYTGCEGVCSPVTTGSVEWVGTMLVVGRAVCAWLLLAFGELLLLCEWAGAQEKSGRSQLRACWVG